MGGIILPTIRATCMAFPNGIPLVIWLEENNHQQPFPGDHGIQFEAVATQVDVPTPVGVR